MSAAGALPSSQRPQSARGTMTIWRLWNGAMSSPGGQVSIVNASPPCVGTWACVRHSPAMPNHSAPANVKDHLSFRPLEPDPKLSCVVSVG